VSIPSVTGKSVIGIWGIIPLLFTITLSYIIKPSSKAIKKLIDRIIDEKSLILFVFYGFLPFFLLIMFDEISNPAIMNKMFIPYLIMYCGAFFFFYMQSKKLRSLALFLGFSLSILISLFIMQ
jgi:hypothetical protein